MAIQSPYRWSCSDFQVNLLKRVMGATLVNGPITQKTGETKNRKKKHTRGNGEERRSKSSPPEIPR